MIKFSGTLFALITATWLVAASAVQASQDQEPIRIISPDHGQTFAYGSVKSHAFVVKGSDHHLALALHLTNDPYVDIDNPRQYDDFVFSFPVILGKDRSTFYFRASDGRSIPVAVKKPGFLGISQILLLPHVSLDIEKPHGLLSVSLWVDSGSGLAEE